MDFYLINGKKISFGNIFVKMHIDLIYARLDYKNAYLHFPQGALY